LISPVLFSLYVNNMPSPSHQVEIAVYEDDTVVIATSRKPTLYVSNLEFYLNDLKRWLSEWRITINISKDSSIIFARAGRALLSAPISNPLRELIEWVEITRYHRDNPR
jgi:hypothetical protein